MTDLVDANGPEGGDDVVATPADTPVTDNRADANGATDDGSNGSAIDWAAGLSEDNRALIEKKQWGGFDIALEGYRNLETHSSALQAKLDEAIVLPEADAEPEAWDALYSKMGRPEAPDGYEFALPEGIPETFPYDAESANKFKTWSHEAGLAPQQAQALHDQYVRDMAEGLEQTTVQAMQAEKTAHDELVSEWGVPESENYKRQLSLAERAMTQLGLKEAFVERNMLATDGGVNDARIAKALAKIGADLYAEDALFGGPSTVDNPWSGDNPNITKQSELVRQAKTDPSRAGYVKSLISAAGKDPKKFGL